MPKFTEDDYVAFFKSQSGAGITPYQGHGIVFPVYQRGRGFGSFASTLFRNHIIPLIPSLLKHFAAAGSDIASDLASNRGATFSEVAKNRGMHALKNVGRDVIDHVGAQLGRGKRKVKKGKKTMKRRHLSKKKNKRSRRGKRKEMVLF